MDKLKDGIEAYGETRLYKPRNPIVEPREKLNETIRSNKKAIAVISDHILRIERDRPDVIGSPYYQQLMDARDEIMAETDTYEGLLEGPVSTVDDAELARQLQAELNPGIHPAASQHKSNPAQSWVKPPNNAPSKDVPSETEPIARYDDWYSGILMAIFAPEADAILDPDIPLRIQMNAMSTMSRWESVKIINDPNFGRIKTYLDLFTTICQTVSEMYVYFPSPRFVVGFRFPQETVMRPQPLDTVLRSAASEYQLIHSRSSNSDNATRIELHSRQASFSDSAPFGSIKYVPQAGTRDMPVCAIHARNLATGLYLMIDATGKLPNTLLNAGTEIIANSPASHMVRVWTNLEINDPSYRNIQMSEIRIAGHLSSNTYLSEQMSNVSRQPVYQPPPESGKRFDIKPYLDMFAKYADIAEMYIYSDTRHRIVGFHRISGLNNSTKESLIHTVEHMGRAYAVQCQSDASVKQVELRSRTDISGRTTPLSIIKHIVTRSDMGTTRYLDIWLDPILGHNGFYISIQGDIPLSL